MANVETSNGHEESTRKSGRVNAHQRDLDLIASLMKDASEDVREALQSLTDTISGYRDEVRDYPAGGSWFGIELEDGTRKAVKMTSAPSLKNTPNLAKAYGPFAFEVGSRVFEKHGKVNSAVPVVYPEAK